LNLSRKVPDVYTRAEIDAALANGVFWRVIRELANRRVLGARRAQHLKSVCQGKLTSGELSHCRDV
jgi:hypothetical protein